MLVGLSIHIYSANSSMEYIFFTIVLQNYRMSSLQVNPRKLISMEDKENAAVIEPVKKGKSELKEKLEWFNPNGILEEDQEEANLMKAKRKMKFESV